MEEKKKKKKIDMHIDDRNTDSGRPMVVWDLIHLALSLTCDEDHLGPESSSGRRFAVESAMIQSVLGWCV